MAGKVRLILPLARQGRGNAFSTGTPYPPLPLRERGGGEGELQLYLPNLPDPRGGNLKAAGTTGAWSFFTGAAGACCFILPILSRGMASPVAMAGNAGSLRSATSASSRTSARAPRSRSTPSSHSALMTSLWSG